MSNKINDFTAISASANTDALGVSSKLKAEILRLKSVKEKSISTQKIVSK